MRAYRLVEARHAHSSQDALSGEGAFLFGGRWNTKGSLVVYAAEHLSLTILEVLVHNQDRKKLKDYRLLTLDIPQLVIAHLDTAELPQDWQDNLDGTRPYGERWLLASRKAALVVPSVIVPGEHNVLLNPAHSDFARINASEPMPFRFDPRL